MCRLWCRKSPALWASYVDSAFTESFETLIAKCHGPLGSHEDKYVEQNEAKLAQNMRDILRVISSRDVNIVEFVHRFEEDIAG